MKKLPTVIKIVISILLLMILLVVFVAPVLCTVVDELTGTIDKPVIYLYPEEETDVSVQLDFNGELLVTYPTYVNGWEVTAYPDGTLFVGDREYSYLFWEGQADIEYDWSKGFVVAGEDTEAFLVETMAYLGLTPTEYNEFIVYWLPKMINNSYNFITFQQENYTDNAILIIVPEPDSVLRVFMAYQPLEQAIEVEPQVLESFGREGFVVIEWGGVEVLS